MSSTSKEIAHKTGASPATRALGLWLWLSVAAAVISIVGSVIGLANSRIYASLTPTFLPQAYAQDIVNLAIASPALIILAVLALRGSLRAFLLWLGVLVFNIYNYVIYTFSVPFGPLFLVWVAVLGLNLYALIGSVVTADRTTVQAGYSNRGAVKATAWFLIVAAILFAFVWLSEDVPALIAGRTPQSLIDLNIPTNPIHILDLSFFIPAVILIGVWLLRGKAFAFTAAPAFIVFLMMTCIPVLLTPVVQANLGQVAIWGAVGPLGAIALILLGLLVWLMGTIRQA